jgi:hypothetical protein
MSGRMRAQKPQSPYHVGGRFGSQCIELRRANSIVDTLDDLESRQPSGQDSSRLFSFPKTTGSSHGSRSVASTTHVQCPQSGRPRKACLAKESRKRAQHATTQANRTRGAANLLRHQQGLHVAEVLSEALDPDADLVERHRLSFA